MRKKTKRKVWQKENPIQVALFSAMSFKQHKEYVAVSTRNYDSLLSLKQGRAVKLDMQNLTNAVDTAHALAHFGFGNEYLTELDGASHAVVDIVTRARKTGEITCTRQDISALELMFDIHDAQLSVISVAEYNKAVTYVNARINSGNSVLLTLEVEDDKDTVDTRGLQS